MIPHISRLFVFLLLITASACTKDVGILPSKPAVPSGPLETDSCTTGVRYSSYVSKIISGTCSLPGCHVDSGYMDFSNYELLKSQIEAVGVSHFIQRIKPGGGMPPPYSPGPDLTPCDIDRIEAWVNSGYPEN